MTDKERYEKYIKEHCKNCLNRDTDLCEIRIARVNNTVATNCEYYER